MSENMRQVGGEGEQRAQQFLVSHGFKIVCCNYGIGRGEIDIIAYDIDATLVFIEVKYVRGTEYGSASSKVTPSKLATITRVAEHYLTTHQLHGMPCRIDVIAIDQDSITHHKNCFTL